MLLSAMSPLAPKAISTVAGIDKAVRVLLAGGGIGKSLRRQVQIFHAEWFPEGCCGGPCVQGGAVSHRCPASIVGGRPAVRQTGMAALSCSAGVLMAARKAAVVARTREPPQRAQLTAAARVSSC